MHAISSGVMEKRMRRIERIIEEVAKGLKAKGYTEEAAAKAVEKEEFVELLGEIANDASAATNEDKRGRFRDLLLNAIVLPEGANEWEEARLAAEWLQELEGPALAVLAAMVRCHAHGGKWELVYFGYNEAYVSVIADPGQGRNVIPIAYSATLVLHSRKRLDEMGLIAMNAGKVERPYDAKSSGHGDRMTANGELLTEWVVGERKSK